MNEQIRVEIRAAMSKQGLTQAELARRLGITPPSLAQVLSGKRGVMPESLMGVLHALGLTLEAVPVKQKGEG